MSDLAKQLKELVRDKKDVAPLLRALTPQQREDLIPTAQEIVDAYFEDARRYEYEKSPKNVSAIALYFLDVPSELLGNCVGCKFFEEVVNNRPDIVDFFVPIDFEKKLILSSVKYEHRMRYFKAGIVSLEKSDKMADTLYEQIAFGDRQGHTVDESYAMLFKYPETMSVHLSLLFDAGVGFESDLRWNEVFAKLFTENHLSHEQYLKWVFEGLQKTCALRKAEDEFVYFEVSRLECFYTFIKSWKPTPAKLLPYHEKMLIGVASDWKKVGTVSTALTKLLVKHPEYDAQPLFDLLTERWEGLKDAEVRRFMTILSALIKPHPKLKPNILKLLNTLAPRSGKKRMDYLQAVAKKAKVEISSGSLADAAIASKQSLEEASSSDSLAKMLSSEDDINVTLGLHLAGTLDSAEGWLEPLVVLVRTSDNPEFVEAAQALLDKHGSDALKASLERDAQFGAEYTESTIKQAIRKHVDDNELDGVRFARALQSRTGRGSSYVLAYGSASEKDMAFSQYIRGKTANLSGLELRGIPPQLYKYKDLTEIDLSDNAIKTIPAKIKIFKQLEILNLSNNYIDKVNDNFALLTKLEVLNLSENKFTSSLPEVLFASSVLRDLDISGAASRHGGMLPESFFKLKSLQKLTVVPQHHRATYVNFPNIKVLTGNPIVLDALAIARAELKRGNKDVAFFLITDGESQDIKNGLETLFNSDSKTLKISFIKLNPVPAELVPMGIETLSLESCELGVDAYWQKIDVKEAIPADLALTAPLSQLAELRHLKITDLTLSALAPLSSCTKLEHLHLENLRLHHFDLSLPHPEKLKRFIGDNPVEVKNPDVWQPFIDDMAKLTGLEYFEYKSFDHSGKTQKLLEKVKVVLPKNCEFVLKGRVADSEDDEDSS